MQRILLVGGGTGGHVYPLIAIAQEILNQNPAAQLQFLGDGELLKTEAAGLNVKFHKMLNSKWRRYFSFLNFLDLLKLPFGLLQALFYVWLFMPDVIFLKGGYTSFLPALAGKLLFIPLVIHESDAIPGAANRLIARFTKKVFISLEAARNRLHAKVIEHSGNPIRTEIARLAQTPGDRSAAVTAFKLDPTKPVVLVTGAAQGAKLINDMVLAALPSLVPDFQVIHQTGPKHFEAVAKQADQILKTVESYRVYPLFDLKQLLLAYTTADVIVSRAGSQIFETALLGKAAVLVPLANAGNNHQLANARELGKFGAIVIEEGNLSPHILATEIKQAYANRTLVVEKIKQFAKPGAASTIANYLLSFA